MLDLMGGAFSRLGMTIVKQASAGSTREYHLAAKLLLAGVSVVVALLVVEAGLRTQAWIADDDRLDVALAREEPPLARGQHATLRQLVRTSLNNRIVYELRPDLDVMFLGERVVTSPDGLRAPVPVLTPPPDTVRIVGIGDSVMFGWGVPYERSYLPELATRLHVAARDTRWEVVNLAVPGYNTTMEVEALRVKGLRWAPDIVIVGYIWNDLELPYFLRERVDPWSLREWFLAPALGRSVRTLRASRGDPSAIATGAWSSPDTLVESGSGRVPENYRSLVGVEAFRNAMSELAALSRAHGFAVIVHVDSRLPDVLMAVCRSVGVTVVEQGPILDAYMARHGITDLVGSVLTLSAEDPHPSALVHALIAEALVDPVLAAVASHR